jgi:hypothetical protein
MAKIYNTLQVLTFNFFITTCLKKNWVLPCGSGYHIFCLNIFITAGLVKQKNIYRIQGMTNVLLYK